MDRLDRYQKVTTAHRAKLAYVYVRQSSLSQVTRHGESTELQYRLVERAIALGWPRENGCGSSMRTWAKAGPRPSSASASNS